ncbi:MAG: PDZ domain-containing protein [bacterium]|nr:PDZ domain-containing protein [bacterium]
MERNTSVATLAAYAPPDCRFFLQFERPANINPNLRDVNAWRLFHLLAGTVPESDASPGNWYDTLASNLAGESVAAMRELFSERAALAAPNWSRMSDGLVLVQVPNPGALRRLVGPGMVKSKEQRGKLTLYETSRGLSIATDGRTVVIGRHGPKTGLFARSLALLSGQSTDSLAQSASFSTRARELPRRAPDGFLYFANDDVTTTAPADESTPGLLWPHLQSGVVGMYVPQRSRADFLLRGALATPSTRSSPRVAIRRVKRLPISALVAWATALDVDAAYERLLQAQPGTVRARIAGFVSRLYDLDQLRRDVVSKVGPRAILVWGHDFVAEEGGSSPGLLLQSIDAGGVRSALDTAVHTVVEAVNAQSSSNGVDRIQVSTETIGGAEVTVVHLADYLAGQPVTAATSLAMTLQPCYTTLDDWLVIAWDLNQMREMIEAHDGTRPTLGEFPDVARLIPQRGPTALGVGQLATAAAVLGDWLDRADRDPHSILNIYTRRPGEETTISSRLLGLSLGPQVRPGRVEVVKVYEDGPCAQRVEVGDNLVAVDGLVLDLEDSTADLRRRLWNPQRQSTLTLRIERQDRLLDLEVTIASPENPRQKEVDDAVRALRRLQALCRHLSFATFAVTPSDADSYHAHLRLRFSQTP